MRVNIRDSEKPGENSRTTVSIRRTSNRPAPNSSRVGQDTRSSTPMARAVSGPISQRVSGTGMPRTTGRRIVRSMVCMSARPRAGRASGLTVCPRACAWMRSNSASASSMVSAMSSRRTPSTWPITFQACR